MDDIYKTNVKTMSADLLKAIELYNEEPKDMISVETVRQWWADALDGEAWLHATTSLSMPFILTENPDCRDCCFLSVALDQKEHSHALELESGTEPGTDRPHGLVLVLLASVVQLKPKLTGHEAIMTEHLI
jgi:hypothetical protein